MIEKLSALPNTKEKLQAIDSCAWYSVNNDSKLLGELHLLLSRESLKQKDTFYRLEALILEMIFTGKTGKKAKNIPLLQKAFKLAEASKDTFHLGILNRKYAKYFASISEWEKSRSYLLKSIYLLEQSKDSIELINSYVELANFFSSRNNLKETIFFYKKAVKFAERKNLYRMLPHYYTRLHSAYKKIEKLDSAKYFLKKSIQSNLVAKDSLIYGINNMHLANFYSNENKLDSALILNQMVLNLFKRDDNKLFINISNQRIAGIYQKQKKYKQAIQFYKKSVAISRKTLNLSMIQTNYEHISECYYQLGDFKKSIDNLQEALFWKDSLKNQERNKVAKEIDTKFETQRKENQIQLLKKEKEIQGVKSRQQKIVFSIVLILISLISIGLFYISRQKIKNNRLMNEKKEAENSLKIQELEKDLQIQSMTAMISGQEQERERIARDLHDSLGGMLSAIKVQFDSIQNENPEIQEIKLYNNANKQLDLACDEVRNIAQNLGSESLNKFGLITAIEDLLERIKSFTKLEIDFQTYGNLEIKSSQNELLIYRIIQELLNNVVKHAQAKEILLQINAQENQINIMLEDDGIGFNPEDAKLGMGLKNIKSRIKFLNGKFSIDSVSNQGTSVLIDLPIV